METATIKRAEIDRNSHYKGCRDRWKQLLQSVQRSMETDDIKGAEIDGNSHYKACRDRWRQMI
jgi:hypothetical protein